MNNATAIFNMAHGKLYELAKAEGTLEAQILACADECRRTLHAMAEEFAKSQKHILVSDLKHLSNSNPGSHSAIDAAIGRLNMDIGAGDMVKFKITARKRLGQIGNVISASDPAAQGGLVVVEILFGRTGTEQNVPVDNLELVQSYALEQPK